MVYDNNYRKHMMLYHGSDQVVKEPIILEPERKMDFGKGFYTTTSFTQARKWAIDVKKKRGSDGAYVSEYEYTESGTMDILLFDGPTADWLHFIESSRIAGKNHDHDIVVGPVADEGVYYILMLYETGTLSVMETIARLETAKLDDQVLFHTSRSLCDITFLGYREVQRWRRRSGSSSKVF